MLISEVPIKKRSKVSLPCNLNIFGSADLERTVKPNFCNYCDCARVMASLLQG